MEKHHIDSQLLARYMSGECTREEEAAVQAWAHASSERREFLRDVERIWNAAEVSPDEHTTPEIGVEKDWQSLKKRMDAREYGTSHLRRVTNLDRANGQQNRSTSALAQVLRVAAVVVLLIGGAVLFVQFSETTSPEVVEESSYQHIITDPGQRATVHLGDGTRVVLNVDSELRVPRTFNQSARQVQLIGEAYFEVTSDAHQPFIIRSEHASVQVLGTKFDVRAYADEQVRVVVEEGTVSMVSGASPDAESVELVAGQMGRLTSDFSGVAVSDVDINDYLGWRQGRLVFRETPLRDVAATLERWYDIDAEFREDAILDRRLTASLNSQSLRNVLDVIAVSLSIEYTITGETVVFAARDTTGAGHARTM